MNISMFCAFGLFLTAVNFADSSLELNSGQLTSRR